MEELLARVLQLMQRYGVRTPERLPARAMAGTQLPVEGEERQVLLVGDTEVGGGGTVLMRSPYMWAVWTVTSTRADDLQFTQTYKTGPSSWAFARCPCGVEVKATIVRRWYPAVDPVMDVTTGLITGGAAAAITPPETLSAAYLPMVSPAMLAELATTLYWGARPGYGLWAADMPPLAIGTHDLCYCPPTRHRLVANSSSNITWSSILRSSTGAITTLYSAGPNTSQLLELGDWASLRAVVAAGTPNVSVLFHG